MRCRYLFVLVVLGILFGQAFGDPIDGVDFQSESVATADKASAGLINPAGLGYFNSMAMEYIHNFADSTYKGDDGGILTSKGLFFSIEWLKHDDNIFRRKYTFAAGDRIYNNLYAGLSYSWFGGSNVFYKGRKNWKIGLLYRPQRYLSFGLIADRLNQPKFGTIKERRFYRPGVALRPMRDWFTIYADGLFDEGRHLNKMQAAIGFQAGPFHGLNFTGEYRTEGNWRLGLVFDVQQSRIGGQAKLNNSHGFGGGSYFIEVGEMRYSSVVSGLTGRMLLKDNIVEEPREHPIFGKGSHSFFSVISCLREGAADPRIGALILKLDGISLNFAKAQELRDALAEYHANNKKVTVYMSQGGNLEYYLASAADQIYMDPSGLLELKGLAATASFYKGTMNKLGVRAEVVHTGPYKTFGDAFTETTLTQSAREQIDWLLDDLYDQFVNGISSGRNILPEKVKALIDAGPYTARDAYDAGLVDGLKHYDEVKEQEHSFFGSPDLFSFYNIPDYDPRWGDSKKIALVYANGAIITGESGRTLLEGRTVGSETIVKSLEKIRDSKEIKGVILRVDSPGGDVFASEEIYRQLELMKGKKPLVISMAGVAASGGYYISAPGDEIMASPGTITGSIGVVMGKVDLSGFYEKIGMGHETLKRGTHADIRSTTRPASEEEMQIVEKMMWEYYDDFVSKVGTWRNMSNDSIDAIGQGRVWTGHQALERGLIDRYGGIWDAIDEVRQKAGISSDDKIEILAYPIYGFQLIPNISLAGMESQITSAMNQIEDANFYYKPPYQLKIR